MRKSHATGWENDLDWRKERVTPAQLKEFYDQVDSLRINRYRLQAFLNAPEPTAGGSVSETGIQPGMAIVYDIETGLLTLQSHDGSEMSWGDYDNKWPVGPLSIGGFCNLAGLIARTHGLEISKFEPRPDSSETYICFRFIRRGKTSR